MLRNEPLTVLRKHNHQLGNEYMIEYFTKKTAENYPSRSGARLFVTLLIGKEKMRDLRRKLNPLSPI